MRYKTALLFVWLRLMGCVCEGSSANYEVTEYESKKPEGDTLEIYFSDVEELKDYLNNNPKVQEYFSKQFANNDGEFCKTSRATTIATTLTTSPKSSTPSSPDDDIQKCLNGNFCHEDANCTNFPSGYNCSCKAGFTGNGTFCTDINECTDVNACHEYANCTNFPSSYNCSCKAGFKGNGTLCTDIDECLKENSCHVHANCTNFPSGYNCSCKAGYTGNGTLCTDVNECVVGSHNCNITANSSCVNRIGGFTCTCDSGFTGNQTHCQDIDECTDGSNKCGEGGNCTNIQGSYECSCHPGFTWNGKQCSDIDECLNKESCHMDANCTNFPSGYNCSCRPDFTGNGRPCNDTTTHDASIAGCAVLDEKNACNITYKGKCFIIWNKGSAGQNVDLDKASDYCARHGFQLGNIYDDCLYSHIKNQIGDVSAILWTGMTVAFDHGNHHQIYLHSNETAKFRPEWSNGFPINDGNKNLQIQHTYRFIYRLHKTSLTNNRNDTKGHGALCEKDVDK